MDKEHYAGKIRVVYAGSFDPPTNGHVNIIRRAAALFEEVVVAIGVNPDKKYTFSLEDRLDMLRDIAKDLSNVEIDSFEGLYLLAYAHSVHADAILRGLRDESDFQEENAWWYFINAQDPGMEVIYMMPPSDLNFVSSSRVKGLVGPNGWQEVVQQYVPDIVFHKLKESYDERSRKNWVA